MKLSDFTEAVEAATTPDEIRALLARSPARATKCLAIIARKAKAWDDALVQLLLFSNVGYPDLLQNPNRPANAERLLAEWAVNRLLSEISRNLLDPAYNILSRLAQARAFSIGDAVVQSLIASLKPKRGMMARRQIYAARVVLQHPDADQRVLDELLDVVGAGLTPKLTASVILHPCATRTIQRLALENMARGAESSRHLIQVFERDDLRNAPELRPLLVEIALAEKARYPRIALVEDGNPTDCATLFRAIVAHDAHDAGAALARATERIASHLATDDITPFLEDRNPMVRAAAITSLGLAQSSAPQRRFGRV